jgi:hypothetical protein
MLRPLPPLLTRDVLEAGMPEGTILNVNIPVGEIRALD